MFVSSNLTAAENLAQAIRQVARDEAAELWGITDRELKEIYGGHWSSWGRYRCKIWKYICKEGHDYGRTNRTRLHLL
jgi:hypothetical protein